MLKTYSIDIPIYNTCVDLYLGDFNDVMPYALKTYNVMIDADVFEGADACTVNLVNAGIPGLIILAIDRFFDLTERTRFSLLSHEVLHASMCILKNAGVPVNNDNGEALAYVQQFIFTKAYDIFRQLEKKNKKGTK